MSTDSLWYRNVVSLGSPETEEKRLPRLSRKRWSSILIGPSVSMAMGTKRCDWMSSAYLALFRVAAASAASQGVTDVVGV